MSKLSEAVTCRGWYENIPPSGSILGAGTAGKNASGGA